MKFITSKLLPVVDVVKPFFEENLDWKMFALNVKNAIFK